jgi:hypothetical protein
MSKRLICLTNLACPDGLEPPPPWFVVFHLGSRILLKVRLNPRTRCPIKSVYLALFRAIWACLSPSIGQGSRHSQSHSELCCEPIFGQRSQEPPEQSQPKLWPWTTTDVSPFGANRLDQFDPYIAS